MRLWFGLAVVALEACGLEVVGTQGQTAPNVPLEAGPDGQAEVSSPPPVPPANLDAGTPDADAGRPALCSGVQEGVLLCVAFENAVLDLSPAPLPISEKMTTFGPGVEGLAVILGAGTRLEVPNDARWFVSNVSLEAWVKLDSLPAMMNARYAVVSNDKTFDLAVLADGTASCTIGGVEVHSATGAVTVGSWVHLACTGGASGSALYLNGSAVAQSPLGTVIDDPKMTNVFIGAKGSMPAADHLIGSMDNLRVLSRILSADEIGNDARLPH